MQILSVGIQSFHVVSVPLRGMWFEIGLMTMRTLFEWLRFPSPYGECGLK